MARKVGPEKEATKEQAPTETAPKVGTIAEFASLDKKTDARAETRAKLARTDADKAEGFGKRDTYGYVLIPSREKGTLWRAGKDGSIDVSRDSGCTWELQASPADADLLAGVSPAKNVVWVVGRGGVVLRTTDGRIWQKLSSPTGEDLVGVQAKDAQAASVVSASGRVFLTQDGSRTWQPKQ
jgi:hypothetical protein